MDQLDTHKNHTYSNFCVECKSDDNGNEIVKPLKCPQCKKELDWVRVYSECYQRGELRGNEIVDYGSIDEITETVGIECPECGYDFYKKGGLEY